MFYCGRALATLVDLGDGKWIDPLLSLAPLPLKSGVDQVECVGISCFCLFTSSACLYFRRMKCFVLVVFIIIIVRQVYDFVFSCFINMKAHTILYGSFKEYMYIMMQPQNV